MPDNEFEYVDEHGNELSAEDVAALGDDVEIVEEEVVEAPAAAPAQPAAENASPAPVTAPASSGSKVPKGLIAGAAALVLLVGGGVAYGMHELGNQNTTDDVKAAISSKSVAVSSAVESKKAEAISAKGEFLTGQRCPIAAVRGAQWDGEELPEYQLQTVGKTALPAGFRERVAKREKGEPREIVMLQLSDPRLGVYVSGTSVDSQSGKSTWWKTTVGITGEEPAVIGDGQGDGTDRDMRGACESVPEGGYLVMADGAEEAPDAPTKLLMLKPAAGEDGVVYAVNADGTELLRLRVAQTPAQAREHSEGGDAASSSPVPSK
ncbi:hypothetical protein GII30_15040 [Gordonia amarae]|uniref:Uncharacterized protein n=2 Tax=Gordonia amarae TaxID=36821 RepID=G7GJV8_9ACTN|nr:hypothetical protein [Gordonia amarae]MCS3879720.1 hypothetical protein [Gordonia amarae]QHN18158.1 hypothetical protein GII35_15355 [Gordonia amarae]QHN31545.1 hypothetical protein GII32_15205 [Gordonia amarae]QHN40289.1 hypothetical protein GII30_15040 [Gordonia amarae]GAB03883.1 hypothetical protein GOAMR_06_00890 [Gordonia amarae NBRC 15530]